MPIYVVQKLQAGNFGNILTFAKEGCMKTRSFHYTLFYLANAMRRKEGKLEN